VTAVYPAEREVFGKHFRGRDVAMGLGEATALIHKYLPDWEVRRTNGREAAGSFCSPGRKLISLARDAGKPIVLHEMAHALDGKRSGHGLNFQLVFIVLVHEEMSKRWATRLRKAFISHETRGHKTLMDEEVKCFVVGSARRPSSEVEA
jgi:hypothetical protein